MHSRTAAHAGLLVAFAASASAFAPAPLSALRSGAAAPRSATRPASTSVKMFDPLLVAKGLTVSGAAACFAADGASTRPRRALFSLLFTGRRVGSDTLQRTPVPALAGIPAMYSLFSFNEYMTHKYYQHNEAQLNA
ncbi:hypothetical protein T484DRAFT_1861042 [Baffinella frigidus]|nr:hypothetical protein T484DRAFT_1861042 [Cryptophyta sp. CCMP2293]